jgi:hypothetical protein
MAVADSFGGFISRSIHPLLLGLWEGNREKAVYFMAARKLRDSIFFF